MSNITELTLKKIVTGIKKKEFSSVEVTKSFIQNSRNSKKLNTYITECFDEAIISAKNFDKKKDYKGLLAGVPIAVKDLFCTKNVKTTAGSKILHNFIPTYESTVTNKLWEQGAFLLGKLNICGDRLGNLPIHTLECNHHFHYECILKSFQTSQEHNNVCPYCRHTIERLPVVNGLKKLTRGIHYITEYEKINYNYKNIPCQHVLKSGKKPFHI